MLVVTRKSRNSVYHDLGRKVPYASNEDHETSCGALWYYNFENWKTEIVEEEAAVEVGKRPCMNCFKDRYTRRDVTHDRGVGFDDYTRNLAWQ